MEARTLDYGAIGWAVNHIRHGHKMRRAVWPRGVYVALDTSGGPPGIIKLFGSSPGNPPQGTLYESANADLLMGDWAMLDPVLPGEYHSAS